MFFHVSYSSLFVSIVPRESYVEANSFLAGSRAFSFVAGPSVGGILVQVLKAPFALVVDAVTYLVSALFLRSISPGGAPDGGGRERARASRVCASSGQPVDAGLAARNGDDQPLQLHLLGALHPLRRPFPGRRAGHARARPRRGRGRRRDRLARSRPASGRRIGIGPTYVLGCILFPAPLVLVPLGGRPEAGSCSRCSSSRSSAAGSA